MQQAKFYYCIDGESITSVDDYGLLVCDRGLSYGHGLFESMRYEDGDLPLQTSHLSRFLRDAKTLGIDLDGNHIRSQLASFIRRLCDDEIKQGVIKIIATAGSDGRGYESPAPGRPRIILVYNVLPEPDAIDRQRRQGVKLWHCSYRLPINLRLAGIKHLNRLDQVMARREWNCSEFVDGLMFNTDNELVETVSANIFVKTLANKWVTPSLASAGVSGVMRALLVDEIFPALDLSVSVAQVCADELSRCTELFICNSIRGIIPVIAFADSDNVGINDRVIGVQTKMLQARLADQYGCFR